MRIDFDPTGRQPIGRERLARAGDSLISSPGGAGSERVVVG